MRANWGGDPTTVLIGYDDWSEYPRKHSPDDWRAIRLTAGAINGRAASLPLMDLRRVVLIDQRPKPTKPPREISPRAIKWALILVFVLTVAIQCAESHKRPFEPASVPVSTITTPYACGLGYDEHITSAVLESPGVNGSQSVYQVVCSSGESLAVFQR